MITVGQLKEVSIENCKELELLASALHVSERKTSPKEIDAILKNPYIIFVVAKDDSRIIGMGALYLNQKIGKLAGYIDDVIVDATYRGQGLGEKIVQAIITSAREHHVPSITLTSSSKRTAAHRLYEKLGFKKYETNVFKISL
ncbi:MAG: GNAT family N-acetyltransferase [Patescibacteria group bacterium]